MGEYKIDKIVNLEGPGALSSTPPPPFDSKPTRESYPDNDRRGGGWEEKFFRLCNIDRDNAPEFGFNGAELVLNCADPRDVKALFEKLKKEGVGACIASIYVSFPMHPWAFGDDSAVVNAITDWLNWLSSTQMPFSPKKILLHYGTIDLTCISAFADALSRVAVKEVEINCNVGGDVGIASFLSALTGHPTLETINMDCHGHGPQSAQALTELLRTPSALSSFASTGWSVDGFTIIPAIFAMSGNPHLKQMTMLNLDRKPDAVMALIKALISLFSESPNSNLEYFWGGTFIPPGPIMAEYQKLKENLKGLGRKVTVTIN